MDVTRILSEIDAEISRLQQARAALVAIGGTGAVAATKRRGRPKGSTNAAKSTSTATKTAKTVAPKRKRNLTPEGRKRIADAMKKRWAARKAPSKTAAK